MTFCHETSDHLLAELGLDNTASPAEVEKELLDLGMTVFTPPGDADVLGEIDRAITSIPNCSFLSGLPEVITQDPEAMQLIYVDMVLGWVY